MPTRRTTLLGLGLLTAGGAGAAATGAFTAATAERTVEVTAANEEDAIIAFQPTNNNYASIDSDTEELELTLKDLNENANFTFKDTFIIINNSDVTVALDSVGTNANDDDNGRNWRNDDSAAAVGVLIGENVNQWQGSPNTDFIDTDVVDPDPNTNTDGGYYDFGDIDNGDVSAVLSPPGENDDYGDWVSIGFQFGTSDDVGGWNEADVPHSLRFEFSQDTS